MSFLPLMNLTPTLKVAVVEVEGLPPPEILMDILPINDEIVSLIFGDVQRGLPQKKHFKHNLTIRLNFRGMNVVVRIKNKFHITGIRTTKDAIDVTQCIIAHAQCNGKIVNVTDVMQNYLFWLPKPIDIHIFPNLIPEPFIVCRSWSSKEKMTVKFEIAEGKFATFTISASGSISLSGKSGELMVPAYNAFIRMYMKIKEQVSIDREIKIRIDRNSVVGVSRLPELADTYMRELLVSA